MKEVFEQENSLQPYQKQLHAQTIFYGSFILILKLFNMSTLAVHIRVIASLRSGTRGFKKGNWGYTAYLEQIIAGFWVNVYNQVQIILCKNILLFQALSNCKRVD